MVWLWRRPRITPDGLLTGLVIEDAPPVVTSKTLKFTRARTLLQRKSHEPVYVDTAQQEFNYPSGSESVYTSYAGKGGLPDIIDGDEIGRGHSLWRCQRSAD